MKGTDLKVKVKQGEEREHNAAARRGQGGKMHGRKREPKDVKHSAARVEAKRRKAKLYAQLSRECFSRRREKRYDEETLALCEKLLEMNCELYTLWNHRKEYLEPVLGGGESEADSGRVKSAGQKELRLIESCLQKNPKSYCCWQHRRWVVSLLHARGAANLDHEIALCQLLLSVDERNFHCWSYRRFVVKLSQRDLDAELDFTTDKISQNFSNYSSWHYRSALLPEVHKVTTLSDLVASPPGDAEANAKRVLPLHALDQEFDLVKEAFFTEPEDQSAWLYHAWLLSHLLENRGAAFDDSTVATRLGREVATCGDILAMEPEAKWPLVTLANLLGVQARFLDGAEGEEGSQERAQHLRMRARELYAKLGEVDAMRRGYYADKALSAS